MNKHFSEEHQLHKIYNSSTINVSYSGMDNMGTMAKPQNSILTANKPQQENNCNCRNHTDSPLTGKCNTKSIVYKATIATTNSEKHTLAQPVILLNIDMQTTNQALLKDVKRTKPNSANIFVN